MACAGVVASAGAQIDFFYMRAQAHTDGKASKYVSTTQIREHLPCVPSHVGGYLSCKELPAAYHFSCSPLRTSRGASTAAADA